MSVDGNGRPTVAEKPLSRRRIEREDRRGFREAVAFEDVPAGQRLPLRRSGRQHRGAAADRHAQPGEIHLADLRMHQQPAVERIHAGEDGGARLLQDLDEAVHVARIGDQPVLGADREVGDEVHHQREDVIERQRRDHDFLAGSHGVRHERLELLGIGDEVAVRERGALRKPGGPAGVLQEQQVIAAQRHRREGELRALRQRIGERDRAREPRVHRPGSGSAAPVPSPGRR